MATVTSTTVSPPRLPFPPLKKSHILNCSYHSWHPRYRSITPKARLIPLPPAFISYLRADGIVIPPEHDEHEQEGHRDAWSDSDSGVFSSAEGRQAADGGADSDSDADDPASADPSLGWREVHAAVRREIAALGGVVVPKLNWSAPKDATWMSATNSMECRTAGDVYLLLKSSDFVTHDLEHAFDGCVEGDAGAEGCAEDEDEQERRRRRRQEEDGGEVARTDAPDGDDPPIPYHLVLRKHFQLNPSVEFRCFVAGRRLLALCQRDLNHFDFLFGLRGALLARIQAFFDAKLRDTFPDEDFAFDVYVPPPHDRVWLVDINPWALRTDPLLFSWMELLDMAERREKAEKRGVDGSGGERSTSVRVRAGGVGQAGLGAEEQQVDEDEDGDEPASEDDEDTGSDLEEEEADEDIFTPVFRLVRRDDPEAYSFNTQRYSAHKLPRDVVDASQGGESSLREFAAQWRDVLERRQRQDQEDGDD
ncbi:D123-domain-containing protein [Lineolata rhizophorae]|uniref:D123-domain-containing protein n=1 Tax=Lineolata rhizophorae TaxID=578093 RepID=A0A6A6NSN9_9PEZI|nr:D123-domain-containing protein [Lineolata rhizophorae]